MTLLEHLEQAEGPSRELDARIWAEIDDRDVRVDEQGRMLGRSRTPPHDECVLLDKRFGGPRYTESIDAALTLVPEGKWWVLNSGVSTPHKLSRAFVGLGEHQTDGLGRKPAIALCIAALKARGQADG